MNTKIYHLSTKSDIKYLIPRIPETGVDIFEELTTPRVCFATTIDGCLSAIQQGDLEYYVYVPVNDDCDIVIPTNDQVCDAFLNGEVWILTGIDVKCIGKIKLFDTGTITDRVAVLNRCGHTDTAVFIKYDWEWAEKYDN